MTDLRIRPGLRRVERVMGVTTSLELAGDLSPSTMDELADGVFMWLREVELRFSTSRLESELNRFDRGGLAPCEISADLRSVVERCADLWGATDGYFDAYATGRLDPAGFVKGWAVQTVSDWLVASGAANHCIDAGGDIRARGRGTGGEPWRIGVRHPWDPTRTCLMLSGTDLAVATSGVYEDGPHVIDPRRGKLARGLRSVTVVGPDLGTADAYATAAMAMGRNGLHWLARLSGYTCAVVTDDGRCLQSDGLPLADAFSPAGY